MIKPINGHVLIKPLTHEGFTASQRDTYQEIGIVIALAELITDLKIGDKVYFDAWLVAKFPSEDPENPYWMVKYEDIRAMEHAESKQIQKLYL